MKWPTAVMLKLLLQCQSFAGDFFGCSMVRFESSVLYANGLSTRRISNSLQMVFGLGMDAMSILLWEEPFHCLDWVMQLKWVIIPPPIFPIPVYFIVQHATLTSGLRQLSFSCVNGSRYCWSLPMHFRYIFNASAIMQLSAELKVPKTYEHRKKIIKYPQGTFKNYGELFTKIYLVSPWFFWYHFLSFKNIVI